ncbi:MULTISPECIES: helix-turn-helix domain-containing protein [unclassified Crossiella]|uniref:helix-turn-helix domain-containing protein n=1 Tax=unclassified Crossiella TaxID=2620835 RepID=UPI001FFFD1D8|nr:MULTISPECIES: helix-turn-helix domain-containing protein [unclassified Crossiella]MCK2243667.1 helix-turn-helix domain-containing protein [Crossiella sp. S99.2]MCK2257526.1 helix-turn-helix domain-containing protein [Crossiella sp. S99.1]
MPLLCTPAQAAALLQVRESWLRRRAACRQVPCTFLGKHLRFSRLDLEQILADAARPAETTRRTIPVPGARPRRPERPRGRGRTDSL